MKKTQYGVALVEFALVLPVLLILTFMVTEFGRALYQYNTLTKSVRDAARYLSMQLPGTKIAEAKNLIVYGNIAGTGAPLARGLSISNVPDPTWQATPTGGVPTTIPTVKISITNYTFIPMVTGVFGLNFGNVTYNNISASMRVLQLPATP
jgi:Flp pilus assembly protein TadG